MDEEFEMEMYENDLEAWEEEQVFLDECLERNEPFVDDFEDEVF